MRACILSFVLSHFNFSFFWVTHKKSITSYMDRTPNGVLVHRYKTNQIQRDFETFCLKTYLFFNTLWSSTLLRIARRTECLCESTHRLASASRANSRCRWLLRHCPFMTSGLAFLIRCQRWTCLRFLTSPLVPWRIGMWVSRAKKKKKKRRAYCV